MDWFTIWQLSELAKTFLVMSWASASFIVLIAVSLMGLIIVPGVLKFAVKEYYEMLEAGVEGQQKIERKIAYAEWLRRVNEPEPQKKIDMSEVSIESILALGEEDEEQEL